MIVTIKLESREELQLLEPVLKYLNEVNVQFLVQNAPATDQGEVSEAIPGTSTTKAANIQALLDYVEVADLPGAHKIIIPSREERNER